MKKILGLFLLATASAFGLSINDIKFSQATSASPPGYADRIFSPVASGLIGTDGSFRPQAIVIGANLTLTGNVLSATSSGGSVNWGSIGGTLSNQTDLVAALAGKQSTLTFSTGLTNSSGTITVNSTQVISRLSNLTTNGFVKTGSANGTLSIDTSTYLTTNQTITFIPDSSGDVGGGSSGQTFLSPILVVRGINGTLLSGLATGVLKVTTGTGAISSGGTAISSGLTMATARLLGRSTASSGAIEEITIGTGLSLSGGTLSATGSGGTGTVTTVSVVTANGVSGSVANATTTPAITLTLGAITPSTVNALTLAPQSTGFTIAGGTSSRTLTVSGNATVSGTNTGDQTNITGNAGTATALQTTRAINGVNFDGTTPITIGVDAANITGTTLSNTVVTSSLTTVGVIGTGAWQGSVVTGTYGGTGVNNSTRTITIAGNLVTLGAFTTTITTTGTTGVTLPTAGILATIDQNETFTGVKTFSPTATTSGSSSYLTITMPASTGITTTAESVGVNFTAGTRTWATGNVPLQREHLFRANTIAAVGSSTFTTVVNVDIADPIAGTNATITNGYGLRANNVLFTGIIYAGSGPTTLTNSTGQILTAAFAAGSTGSGAVALAGAPTFTSSIAVGVQSSATGTILLKGTSSGTVTLSVADAAGTNTFKLPATAGSNTNTLATDGSGNLFWQATSTGSGTVNSGTATQFAYYASSTTAVSSTGTVTVSAAGRLTLTPTQVTSGAVVPLTFTMPANDTGITAGTPLAGTSFVGGTRTWASNTSITTQGEYVFNAPTYAFTTSGGVIGNASTVQISGAPALGTNATFTNKFALNVISDDINIQAGGLRFAGNAGSSLTASSNLITINSTGGLNLRSTSIVSIASASDLVVSDSTSTITWQGGTNAGFNGIYIQQNGGNVPKLGLLCVGAGNNCDIQGNVASGSYGSLTASVATQGVSMKLNVYDGSVWALSTGIISITTTETASGSARGNQINFYTTKSGTTTRTLNVNVTNDGKLLNNNATGGIGYGVGAGGVVTQASSRATGVTLNTVSGAITLVSASGSTTPTTFTVTDSAVAALDTVVVSQTSGTDLYIILVTNVAAGSFKITCYTTGGTTSEQPVFHFNVFRGVSS